MSSKNLVVITKKAICQGKGAANKDFIKWHLGNKGKLVIYSPGGKDYSIPSWMNEYVVNNMSLVALLLGINATDFPTDFPAISAAANKINLPLVNEYKDIMEKNRREKEREDYISSFKFLAEIYNVLNEHQINNYAENREEGTVSFVFVSYSGNDLSFDKLSKLSEIIGSRKINLGTNKQVNSGCSTCGHGEEWEQPIFCWEVKF